jgi:hypothetical protein
MDELAQFMGHDDSATTSTHYARYSPGHLMGVATKVQRVKEQADPRSSPVTDSTLPHRNPASI